MVGKGEKVGAGHPSPLELLGLTRLAAAAAAVCVESAADPNSIVGRRIAIMWTKNRREVWYKGTIRDYSPRDKRHTVVYDDGDITKYALFEKQIKFL